jgi:Na+/proline symporter
VNAVTLAILGYVVVQLGIAFFVASRVKNEQDYLVAGRSLGLGMGIFTVFATWFGAETCVGAAAKAYGGGLSETNADPFGYTICLVLMALVFAVPLYRRGLTTLADLFRARWGGGVEKLAALIMVPGSILWAAAQIRAFGIVLGVSSSIDLDVMILIAGGVVIVYTSVGGMWADAYADLIQGCVLITGLVILAVAVFTAGGPGLSSITADQLAIVNTSKPIFTTLEGWCVPIFGSLVAQELIARVISSKSEVVARRAVLSAAALYFVVGIIPPIIGLIAMHALPAGTDGEQALALMAQLHLPTVLYVLFAGALVAAILSTVDSALLAAGALTGHNVIVPMFPDMSERGKLRINRLVVVLFGVLACGFALSAEGVYELVETASSLGTSGVLWLLIFALYGKSFGGPIAATAALIGGVASFVTASAVLELETPFLVSVAVSLALYVAIAVVEKRSGADVRASA